MFRESETVELKQEYSESIRKDIVAFANTEGGTIYIGVSDSGETVGVSSPDQLIQRLTNMARDSIQPDVTMFIHYAAVDSDQKTIVRMTVSRGTARPYYIAAKGLKPEGVYVRQGTSAAPATESAIRRMIKETDGDSYETARSLEQGLTFHYASEIFSRRGLTLEKPQMKTLGLLSAEEIYTNLGLLLSDQCPHMIKAAAFAGSDQERFQDRREFTGSLLKQADEAYAYLDMHNERTATFDGLRRIDHLAYPKAALREALLNAVIHRDYAFSAGTLLTVYADRIEILSAGGLVSGFTLDDVMAGFSVCRNQKLANTFYRLGLIEAYGTGLKKILGSYPDAGPETLFQVTDHVFKVTLPRLAVPTEQAETVKRTQRTGEAQKAQIKNPALPDQVLSFLNENGSITRRDIEQLTGLSTASSIRMLRRLTEEGVLSVTGNGKNTRYRLAQTARP